MERNDAAAELYVIRGMTKKYGEPGDPRQPGLRHPQG